MSKEGNCKREVKGVNIKKELGMNEKVGWNQVSEEDYREEKKFEEVSGRDKGEETIDVNKIYKLIIDNV